MLAYWLNLYRCLISTFTSWTMCNQTLFFSLWQTRLTISAIQSNVPKHELIFVFCQKTNEAFFIKNCDCIRIFMMGMIKYVYNSIMCIIPFIILWKEGKKVCRLLLQWHLLKLHLLQRERPAKLVAREGQHLQNTHRLITSRHETCGILIVVVSPARFAGRWAGVVVVAFFSFRRAGSSSATADRTRADCCPPSCCSLPRQRTSI